MRAPGIVHYAPSPEDMLPAAQGSGAPGKAQQQGSGGGGKQLLAVAGGLGSPPSPETERLRMYRKWYHELDSRRMELTVETEEDARTAGLLDGEIRCLEELIILSTELGNMYPRPFAPNHGRIVPHQPTSALGKNNTTPGGGETWPTDSTLPPVEGLDLSLITDMLMLSATSPWIVYVAERAQWTLCYISPSSKRILGWKPTDLVTSIAWEGCHPDDVADVQRMLSEGGKAPGRTRIVHYRRMRRNCSYVTVQATGRPLGARWYAWVELLMSEVTDLSAAAQGDENSWTPPDPILALSPVASPAVSSPMSVSGPPKSISLKQSSEIHDSERSSPAGMARKIAPGLTQSNSLHRGTYSLPRENHEEVKSPLRRTTQGVNSFSLSYDSELKLQVDKGRTNSAAMGSKLSKGSPPTFEVNKGRESRGGGRGGAEEGEESDTSVASFHAKEGRGSGERDESRSILPIAGGNKSEKSSLESLDSSEEVETIWRKAPRGSTDISSNSLNVAHNIPVAPAPSGSRRRPGPPAGSTPLAGGVGKPRANPGSTGGGLPQEDLNLIRGQKVLLVEDDVVNRTMGQRLLESLGCQVTVTCNGKEALEVMQGNVGEELSPYQRESMLEGEELPPQFDLVLMDLLMPVLDGLNAVEQFRDWEACQTPTRRRMLIFAVTSNVTDGDMVKCAQSGFDEFVSKPLTRDKLIHRLHGVLNQRQTGKPRSLDSSL